ncbi:AAA family ATPase [Pontibacter rugosus]|uniref:AAA family ATPase n=1 Tax=Pontibacter rugosus TaxID=1745966 RepID=A0ABW3SS60_9BACT
MVKLTFYKEHYFNSHVRISMDLLRTRNRERLFLKACLQSSMRFVVDNTNPTAAERAAYIALAKAAKYEVIGYFFESTSRDAVARNSQRSGRFQVPDKAIYGTHKKLQPPKLDEGFDVLYYVSLLPNGAYNLTQQGQQPGGKATML